MAAEREDKVGEDQRRQIVFDWVQKTTDESRPWESCVDELLSALDRVVPSAVAASLDVDLGPYDAISSLKGARYKLIVPGDQPFMAKVIAEVPDLEMARKIIAALRAPRSATGARCPACGMDDKIVCYDARCPYEKRDTTGQPRSHCCELGVPAGKECSDIPESE